MADRQISVHQLIRWLEAKRDEQAVETVRKAVGGEQYWISVGKYRENKGLCDYLEGLIKEAPGKKLAKPKPDDVPDDLGEEDETPKPTPRRHKPRGWGS